MISEFKPLSRSLRAEPDVRAACVLGSIARGDTDRFSDIDLLAVTRDQPGLIGARLRRVIPTSINGRPVQVRVLTATTLAELVAERTIYAAHVGRESLPLFDRRGDLRRARKAFGDGTTLAQSAMPLRRRLALYDDLDFCGGQYLLCLADIYAFARAGAILALGRQGIFEFGRTAPLERLGEVAPTLKLAASFIRPLEPFYLRVRKGSYVPTPFNPQGEQAQAQATQARNACAEILDALP